MQKMDKIDRAILNHLQHDAKLNIKQIASKVGLTVTPTYERIKRLELNGVIKSYVAILDKEKIDKTLEVFCNVSLSSHSKDIITSFEVKIANFHEVMDCYHITGQSDYLLKIIVADINEYQQFLVNKLAVLDNVSNVQSQFVMTNVKSNTPIKL